MILQHADTSHHSPGGNMNNSFHIQWDGPCEPHWPRGAWSVYRISGEEIADRIVREKIVMPERGPPYYSGKVIARHSWCGYLGMWETLPEAMAAIEAARECAVVNVGNQAGSN